VVIVDGPGGIHLTLTPEAAVELGCRLIDEAARAAGQVPRLESFAIFFRH
jgi:hypothetical protein